MLNSETLEQLNSLIQTYEKLIKVQNDLLQEKEERIILLTRYIEVQRLEQQVNELRTLKGLNICLN